MILVILHAIMGNSVVIAGEDIELQKNLKEILFDNGYIVNVAGDGISILNLLQKTLPDLVILDFGLSNFTNRAILNEIKKKYPDVPVIVISPTNTSPETARDLQIEEGNFLTKPFTPEELLTKVKAYLKLYRDNLETKISIADLELDNKTLEITRSGKRIQLTPQEFKLLQFLISNKGKILTREMILSQIWHYSSDIETRVVDVYIGYLRKKIDKNRSKKLLHSIRGFGYVIKE